MKRLLLGPHAVTEALRAAPARVAVIYYETQSVRTLDEILRVARSSEVRAEPRTRAELDGLAQNARHQGVVAIGGDYPYLSLDELLERAGNRPLLLALDEITDPHNFGAIIRSAVALGAAGVVTLKDRAAPVTAAVVRASAGATEFARIVRVTNLARSLAALREAGMQIVGLAAEGSVPLHALPYPAEGRVLVIGSEGDGLRRLVREQCDALTRIELLGEIKALNASVAAGIAIYESLRARAQEQT